MALNRERIPIGNIYDFRIDKAKKFKSLREKKRITKAQMCDYSGLSRTTIDKMETGNKSYSIDCEIIYLETLKKL